MNSPPQQIDYAPAREWYERVNWRTWALWTCLATALIVGLALAPRAYHQYGEYREQQNALAAYLQWRSAEQPGYLASHASSDGTVGRFVRKATLWSPAHLPIAFMGKCRSTSSEDRLLVVFVGTVAPKQYGFSVHSFVPATPWRGLERRGFYSIPATDLTQMPKIIPGIVDPNNSAHFTFECEVNKQTLSFDGWLMPDDTVKIEPREEPATAPQH